MTRRRRERPQDLTPRAIVEELDRYIVGQKAAKRAVAIALRNRWRRQQVPPPMRDEIAPKNIMLIGPTGVGKTEIARRLARLAGAPFVKVEASKFTEVGYVGPRRRLDGARPGRDRGVDAARRGARARAPARARERRGAAARRAAAAGAAHARRARRRRRRRRRRRCRHRRARRRARRRRRAGRRPTTPRARACASCCARGSSTIAMVEIDTADAPQSFIDVFSGTGMEEMVLNLQRHDAAGGSARRSGGA